MKKKDKPFHSSATSTTSGVLLSDIRKLIEETRSFVAITVNSGLTILHWQIGRRINDDILKGKRATYGEEIISTVSRQLVDEYGNGFSAKNLRHMMKFAESFPDSEIVSTLSRQLTWSHFKEIIYMKDPIQKEFYADLFNHIYDEKTAEEAESLIKERYFPALRKAHNRLESKSAS
jgi:hypothetical protein